MKRFCDFIKTKKKTVFSCVEKNIADKFLDYCDNIGLFTTLECFLMPWEQFDSNTCFFIKNNKVYFMIKNSFNKKNLKIIKINSEKVLTKINNFARI